MEASMPDERKVRAIIAGGGIGGLSAAIALRRAGLDVTVLEQAPKLGEVGTGIGVWVNGMVALRELGLADEALARGRAYERQELRSWRGDLLVALPVGDLAKKHRIPPPMIIRRPALLEMLIEALGPGVVQLGAQVASFQQGAGGVTVRLGDGREERGDLLVGADGIRSVVRGALMPEVRPRYAGYQYLRAIAEFSDPSFPPGRFVFAFGRGDRFGLSHIGPDRLYWWAVIPAAEGAQDLSVGRKAEVAQRFRRFMPPIPRLIAATPEDQILRNDIYDLRPLPRWGDGRVTLLGDAAHATTPNLGRGGGEAMEDAVALAAALAPVRAQGEGAAIVSALRAYEARRMEPTAQVQTSAWRIGVTASWRNPLACAARELLMRTVIGKGMAKRYEKEFAAMPSSVAQVR
jgi:2-polyprenyl-6-methoxyphenol hydroxylase-like FAD-dependent oxidoreductase